MFALEPGLHDPDCVNWFVRDWIRLSSSVHRCTGKLKTSTHRQSQRSPPDSSPATATHRGTWHPDRVPPSSRAIRVQGWDRSEEHTSELQSLMSISYAVFCLKKKKTK